MSTPVLTPIQIAERWQCRPDPVRELLDTGKLRGFRVGRRWRCALSEVERYERGEPVPAPAKRQRRKRQATIPDGPF